MSVSRGRKEKTMPTNKERKEIAAKLRETMLTEGAAIVEEREGLEPAVATRFVAIPNLIAALNFNKNIVSIRELTDRLADLIEPEPERTCTIDDIYFPNSETDWGKCSNCNKVFPYQNDVVACPKCGAKVVDE